MSNVIIRLQIRWQANVKCVTDYVFLIDPTILIAGNIVSVTTGKNLSLSLHRYLSLTVLKHVRCLDGWLLTA